MGCEGDGWAAFVKRRGRAVLTPVRIGHEDGFDAEVIDGLSEGDVVVLHPSDRVTDGARIAPRLPAQLHLPQRASAGPVEPEKQVAGHGVA